MITIGDQIPDVKGILTSGEEITLSAFKGQKLAVYFYPKDDTPGCTAQACSIRDGEVTLKKSGIHVIGVSADSVASHSKFSNKYSLSFPLISDPNKVVINAFGVWGTKKFMGRVYDGIHRKTFLFNTEGKLFSVIEKPDTKNHAQEIMDLFTKND
ncbi:MAG: thioredoxin-dependent thiol peroxidase [Flavobacteriales bacterium]|jgi:peroxiredoxin Q/BCP